MSWEYGLIRAWAGTHGHATLTVQLPGGAEGRLDGDASPGRVMTLLSDLGDNGWELTAAESHRNVTVYWLKRPRGEGGATDASA